jgi:type 1 glutamine amidotransferase
MRNLLACALLIVCAGVVSAAGTADSPARVKVLVVTGGHGFKAEPFFQMFEENPDITYATAAQEKAAEAYERADLLSYDVVVLYDSPSTITDDQKARFLSLFDKGVGVIVLHHALLSYQDWPEYERIAGGKYVLDPEKESDRSVRGSNCWNDPGKSGCKADVTIPVTIVAKDHPVTAGLSDFTLTDELYLDVHMRSDVMPLAATGNEVLVWTREQGQSRVVGTMLGHGPPAYADASFRRMLAQSIRWVARR